jgi:hypothetical protein
LTGAELRAGDLAAARRDVALAARREPTNYHHCLLLACIEAERGRATSALEQ